MVNRTLKIVMIGPFAFRPKGTVSARAFFMARALVKRGHQATILMPPYDNLKDSGRAWELDGVRLVNMNLSRNDTWHQLTVPLSMARQATRLDPDLVKLAIPAALRLFIPEVRTGIEHLPRRRWPMLRE